MRNDFNIYLLGNLFFTLKSRSAKEQNARPPEHVAQSHALHAQSTTTAGHYLHQQESLIGHQQPNQSNCFAEANLMPLMANAKVPV